MNRLRGRDPAALSEIHDSYGALVHAVAFRIVGNRSIAEDIAQEVFLKVWTGSRNLEWIKAKPIVPWLMAIARNQAIDFVRSRNGRVFRSTNELQFYHTVIPAPDYETRLTKSYRMGRVLDAMRRLSPLHRGLILDAYVEDLTHAQIAERRQRPLGTIKTWLRQSVAALRHEMAVGNEE